MPWGLWPPSTMNTGSRRSTSNRAGQRVAAMPCRTAASEIFHGVACALGSLYMSGEVRECFRNGKE